MNVLPIGTAAPALRASSLHDELVDLAALWEGAPLVLCFGMPHVHASRLVVGYLRRLNENAPGAEVVVAMQGSVDAVYRYAEGYLDGLRVVHDADLGLSRSYGVSHVPSTYGLSEGGKVVRAFTGFNRPAMNALADWAAAATGVKAKELITVLDNKGEYELAERGLD